MTARFTSTHVAEEDIVVTKIARIDWRGEIDVTVAYFISEYEPCQRTHQFGAPQYERGRVIEYKPGRTLRNVWPFVYGPLTPQKGLAEEVSCDSRLVRLVCKIPKGTPYMRAYAKVHETETLLPRDLHVLHVHPCDTGKV